MTINRRSFLKSIAAGGIMLSTNARPAFSREKPRLPDALGILYDAIYV